MSLKQPKIEKWVLSFHALERIQERKISSQDLQSLIDEPDYWIEQGPKWILGRKVKGRSDNDLAAVVIEKKEQGLWVVLTVMVHFQKK